MQAAGAVLHVPRATEWDAAVLVTCDVIDTEGNQGMLPTRIPARGTGGLNTIKLLSVPTKLLIVVEKMEGVATCCAASEGAGRSDHGRELSGGFVLQTESRTVPKDSAAEAKELLTTSTILGWAANLGVIS